MILTGTLVLTFSCQCQEFDRISWEFDTSFIELSSEMVVHSDLYRNAIPKFLVTIYWKIQHSWFMTQAALHSSLVMHLNPIHHLCFALVVYWILCITRDSCNAALVIHHSCCIFQYIATKNLGILHYIAAAI